MVEVKVLMLLILLETCASGTAQVTAGCIGGDYIISRNSSITPPLLVEASASLLSPSAPPANILFFGYNGDDLQTWCTDTNDNNPYIIINFSTPVLITSFLSSGSTDFAFSVLDTFHVTNFTLEYSNNSGDFVYYQTEQNANRKYFYQAEPVALFKLDRPIITERIRLRPIQWYDSETVNYQYICHGVALFGCMASEAIEEHTTTEQVTTVTMTTSDTDQPSTMVTTTEAEPSPEQIIVKDFQVLEVALPIALLTIIIIIAAVAIGVVLCILKSRLGKSEHYHRYDRPSLSSSQTPLSPGVRVLDNFALYQTPSEVGGDGTIKAFDNELYGEDSGTNIQTVTQTDGEDLEVIYTDANYEYITTPSLPGNQESNSSDRRDSLDDNYAYNSVFTDSNGETSASGNDEKTTPTGSGSANSKEFQVVRNDSYGSVPYESEYSYPTNVLENVYEETAQ